MFRKSFAAALRGFLRGIARLLWRGFGHLALLELLTITLFGVLYIASIVPAPQYASARNLDAQPLLNILLNPEMRQSGLEHERLSGVLIPAEIGLKQYGYIPAWNPYMGTGEPLINNAFSYLFNPFYSLPVLILGAAQGSKFAMFLSVFIAGYSMWVLARAIGLGAVGRVTSATLYMMSGGIVAKFYQGHFQLGLSLAWPPLVLAGLWWTLRARDRRAPVMLAVAFALLFFSGNIYYTLHTLIGMVVITLLHLWERAPESGRWRFQKDRLHRIAIGGGFAFGLAALQFFPVWAVRDFVDHAVQHFNSAGQLAGSYGLAQATTNLIYPWPKWIVFEQPNVGLNVVVDYAYIGPLVFIFMITGIVAALVGRLAFVQRYTRVVLAAFVLALLMMIWGAGQSPILAWLYAHLPLLDEFRFVGRALTVAAMWWIVLAGIGVDILWQMAAEIAPRTAIRDRWRLLLAMGLAGVTWGYFFVYSLAGQTTRLNMVFYNFRWLNTLDAIRLTSFSQAVETLWLFVLVAVGVDTALLMLGLAVQAVWKYARTRWFKGIARFINPWVGTHRRAPWFRARRGRDMIYHAPTGDQDAEKGYVVSGWRRGAARVIRVSVLIGCLAAAADLMVANSPLFTFQHPLANYNSLYQTARQADPEAPFPAINLPFTPLAYDAYYAQVRNWGLNEGWSPIALPGVLPAGKTIPNLPRWAVVIADNVFGASGALAQQFVDAYAYRLRDCQLLPNFVAGQPCEPGAPSTALLYEDAAALPYSFIVTSDQLREAPETLMRETVIPVTVESHRMDTIVIQATAPAQNQTEGANPLPVYYLVVEETHFPGWEASVENTLVEIVTVQTRNISTDPIKGFIGIPLLPGTHTYTLHFQPPGFALGLLLFTFTLIAQTVYLLVPHLKRRT
ncbi:MAG: hypothetical protein H6672_14615 [Anaerolineaceae bacterium]|nr:hypothetical protein [Anaerolineaceae bacterium]